MIDPGERVPFGRTPLTATRAGLRAPLPVELWPDLGREALLPGEAPTP